MARTKRSTRTTRKTARPAGRLDVLRNSAVKAVNELLLRGARLRARAEKYADEARERTSGAMTQLEKAFQARVAAAIAKLGVPNARDVRALSRQVAELQQSVQQLRRSRARA